MTKGYKRKGISSPATVSQPILADPGEASGSQLQASGVQWRWQRWSREWVLIQPFRGISTEMALIPQKIQQVGH